LFLQFLELFAELPAVNLAFKTQLLAILIAGGQPAVPPSRIRPNTIIQQVQAQGIESRGSRIRRHQFPGFTKKTIHALGRRLFFTGPIVQVLGRNPRSELYPHRVSGGRVGWQTERPGWPPLLGEPEKLEIMANPHPESPETRDFSTRSA
jgi:hypothetical protein